MPVKWSPEMDQLLLLKILETCDVNADAKKISSAWPTDCANGLPTARAITERLVKIRDSAKKNGAGHFNISSAQAKGTGAKRAAGGGTPRKARVPTATGSAGKRKRGGGGKDVSGNEDDEEVGGGVGVKTMKEEKDEEEEEEVFWMGESGVGMGGGFGRNGSGAVDVEDVDEDECMESSPLKRAKREGMGTRDVFGSGGFADVL